MFYSRFKLIRAGLNAAETLTLKDGYSKTIK